MAKKQRRIQPKRPPTKRQLAKWQQQRRMQRIALGIGVLFVALILSYVGHGYYINEIKPFRQPVARVDDTVFNMDYYIKALSVYGQGQKPNQLSATADWTIGAIQSNELMRRGAANLGINIKDEEIDKELKRLNLPNDKVYKDIARSQLLLAKLMSEHFSPKVPSVGEQVLVWAMLLESKQVAGEVIAKLETGGDFASLAKEFSREAQTRTKGGELGWLPKGLARILVGSSVLEEVAFSLEPGKLSQPVHDADITKNIGYWLIKVVDKKPEQQEIQAKAILLGSKEEAEVVKAKLELGEDFDALAKSYSQHEQSREKGGDLGWLKPNVMSSAFDKVVFALDPGVLSEPVQDGAVRTKGGYWLVKVVEKDNNRQLDVEAKEKLKNKAFEDWFLEVKSKSVVENYIDEGKKAWAIARITKVRR